MLYSYPLWKMCFSLYQVMGVPKVTGDILSYQFGQPRSLALPAKERGEPGIEAIFWAHFHILAPWQLYVYKHAQVLIGQLLEWEFSLSSFQACDVIYCMHQSLILFHQIRLIPRPSHRPTFDRLHYAKTTARDQKWTVERPGNEATIKQHHWL